MNLVHVEYLKIVAYVLSGFGACRAWFAKEIAKGKAELKAVEQKVVNEAQALKKNL